MTSYPVRLRLVWLVCLSMLAMASGLLRSQTAGGSPRQAPAARTATRKYSGEQVFMANCSRCHMPPMSIPPQATGTVIMHMRTRARLSREDEKLLLKFMAP